MSYSSYSTTSIKFLTPTYTPMTSGINLNKGRDSEKIVERRELEEELSDFKMVKGLPIQDLVIINELYRKDELFTLQCLGSGSFGHVYLYTSLNGKDYAVKEMKEEERHSDSRSQDGKVLSELQGCEFIPKLYAYIPNQLLIMERIEGETIEEIIEYDLNVVSNDLFIESFHDTIRFIRSKGYFPHDLHKGNVMINSNGLPVIIDVGHFLKDLSHYDRFGYSLDDDIRMIENTYESLTEKSLVAM